MLVLIMYSTKSVSNYVHSIYSSHVAKISLFAFCHSKNCQGVTLTKQKGNKLSVPSV